MSAGFDACNLNPTPLEFVGQGSPAPTKPVDSSTASSDRNVVGLSEVVCEPSLSSSQADLKQSKLAEDTQGELSEAGLSAGAGQQGDAVKVPAALQRVAEARMQQGFSLRTIARRTGIELRALRKHEDPTTDMKLSELRAWQLALELPLVDLLEDDLQPLSSPVKDRANLVKIMKTVVALKEAGGPPRVQRLADMLFEQMVELMPELKEVGGWPQHGSRRSGNSRIIEQQVNTQSLGLERLD